MLTPAFFNEYIQANTPREKLEALCVQLASLRGTMMALDRAYISQPLPSADQWSEACGCFNTAQYALDCVCDMANDLLTLFETT